MFPSIQKTRMLSPTPGEREQAGIPRIFAYFLAVWGMGSFGRMAISAIAGILAPHADRTVLLVIDLFGTATASVAVILWVRLFERRSAITLGLTKRGAITDYFIGTVAGVLLFGGAVLVCVLCGVAEVRVATEAPSRWLLFLFLVGFLIQGMSEELLCRSFLMVTLSRKLPLWVCAITNAAVFSALHLLNPGISFMALLNIFLFGLFASLLTLRRGSIWMVSALHSLWNFAQGNLFGIPVSGLSGLPSPLTTTVSSDHSWQTLLGGGTFGLESGLAATLVLALGVVVVLMLPTRTSEIVDR